MSDPGGSELDDFPGAPGDDDEVTRAIVDRLSRRHSSGGQVIERAAILAEGPQSAAIVEWILAHGGRGESAVASGDLRGVHDRPSTAAAPPQRYVLPTPVR